MHPTNLIRPDIIISGEGQQINSPIINTIGFDKHTKINIRIELVVVVWSGDYT